MPFDPYGTNHRPRTWGDPEAFRPERFLGREPTPYELVPQGAGDVRAGHRCPGEALTIAVPERAVRLLAHETRYEVPAHDLRVDLSGMPALPWSGPVVGGVRPVP